MRLSEHATKRMQQRAVSEQVVHLLQNYGRKHFDHHQATVIYLDKRARQHIRRDIGKQKYARIEKKLDAYLVEKNGFVITVGYRYKRLNRH